MSDADVSNASETDEPEDHRKEQVAGGVRWSIVVVAAVIALGIGILGWNLWTSRQETATVPTAGAALLTRSEMQAQLATLGHTVYWAGARDRTTFELTQTGRDVYIRYPAAGQSAGDSTPALTVATYEQDNPYAGLEKASTGTGAKAERLSGGALLVQPGTAPNSAYFAFPDTYLLMEVYDPTPGRAYELVRSGDIQPFS